MGITLLRGFKLLLGNVDICNNNNYFMICKYIVLNGNTGGRRNNKFLFELYNFSRGLNLIFYYISAKNFKFLF